MGSFCLFGVASILALSGCGPQNQLDSLDTDPLPVLTSPQAIPVYKWDSQEATDGSKVVTRELGDSDTYLTVNTLPDGSTVRCLNDNNGLSCDWAHTTPATR